MPLNQHNTKNRFWAAISLLLIAYSSLGCSKSNRTQPTGGVLETQAHDAAIAKYIGTLPKLETAISSIDANRLIGNLDELRGLEQDKANALEALQSVGKYARAVLSSNKLSDDMELTHFTVLLSKILDMLSTDISGLIDQDPVNRTNGFRWLAALTESDDSTTTFETESYSFLLSRAKAIESAGDPTEQR